MKSISNLFQSALGNKKHKMQLKILTWNIWFGKLEFSKRAESILNICIQHEPDIICFQECTHGFIVNHLINSELWDNYDCSDVGDGSSIFNYGVLMLCKKHLNAEFTIRPMSSNMGRDLLRGNFTIKGENMTVGTVHLESLDNHDIREKQLEYCTKSFENYKHAILCGDFNFCSYRNYRTKRKVLENRCLLNICNDYVDIWDDLVVKPYHLSRLSESRALAGDRSNGNSGVYSMHNKLSDDELKSIPAEVLGYTFDSDVNRNIDHHEVRRLDRFIYKTASRGVCSSKMFLRPVSIEIIGKDSINNLDLRTESGSTFVSKEMNPVPLFPSDHFGLVTIIEV